MALKCCNRLCQLVETIELYDTDTQRHRVLVVGRCKNPKCGSLRGEYVYWDMINQKFIYTKIPKPELKSVIEKFKKMPFLTYQKEVKKYGTMANMSWTYSKNGNIYDFNDTFKEKLSTELKLYESDK